MQQLPEPLKAVVDQLAQLPGLGPKSALRAALELLKWPQPRATALGQSILDLREKLFFCDRCASLSDSNPCSICTDPGRSDEQLMVVAEWDSLITLEEGGFYKGRYLVLGGLLAPLENVNPQQLEIARLRERLKEGQVRELILALGTTLEAEATATYLKDMVERDFPQVQVSRLAQGIPLGAEVKFIDRETLRQSLQYRQKL
ncbi:recombination mediator RecR [Desulfobaculum bizertense]|uniref:Recombination protein RecR n=1 Tax=Desulfobaculum bizertense DSM 18034 TaxID=1121442 RepID=A0A1T4W746_9BACT|nr:recombination mediator RecR [Desulfobaculum bizertense]UIJ39031.1 recombination mediator RecR [Desulfobaculum bizertense]SKA72815.1 DNA replication and repair protein RecR [Desulfobaculum bizertense DSM 18034]